MVSSTLIRANRLLLASTRVQGSPVGAGSFYHFIDRDLIGVPFRPVPVILFRDFPFLVSEFLAALEPSFLFILGDVEPELAEHIIVLHQLFLLEVIDLAVGPFPLAFGGKSLDPFHEDAPRTRTGRKSSPVPQWECAARIATDNDGSPPHR